MLNAHHFTPLPESIEEQLPSLLEHAFSRFSDRLAIVVNGETISYADLDNRARRLAALFASKITAHPSPICVLLDKRVDIIISLLATLRTGDVFVPMDANGPPERLATILAELQTAYLLTTDGANPSLEANAAESSTSLALRDSGMMQPLEGANYVSDPNAMVYIYYTSGSTGMPKGIIGSLGGLSHFIHWEIATFALEGGYRISQFTAPTFDALLRDILVPLVTGGTICIPPDDPFSLTPAALVGWINAQRVEAIHCVPSLLRLLLSNSLQVDDFVYLRYVFLSGEPLTTADVQKWRNIFGDRNSLVQFYGATEATMIQMYHVVDADDLKRDFVSLGAPIGGTSVTIMGDSGRECSIDEIGEIHIRSRYCSLGYYHDPELTSAVFVQLSDVDQRDCLYKTGDLARRMEDGSIQFIGRRDGLVKIGGSRVSLQEIEAVLRRSGLVDDIVVVASADLAEDPRLIAYYVSAAGVVSATQLRKFLLRRVPRYMIPALFILIDKVPLNSHGKVDRKALQEHLAGLSHTPRSSPIPRTVSEQLLARLWCEVLNVSDVGINDNFLELGGHSLAAMRVIARINQVAGVDLSIAALLSTRDLAELGELIDSAPHNNKSAGSAIPRRPTTC